MALLQRVWGSGRVCMHPGATEVATYAGEHGPEMVAFLPTQEGP